MAGDSHPDDGSPGPPVGVGGVGWPGGRREGPEAGLAGPGDPASRVVWVRVSPSQVMRAVLVALLTAAVVSGAGLLVWQARSFVGWFVISLFLAAVLNPAVDWLQRRHGLIGRGLAILLVYAGLVVALLFVAGILLPVLADQIEGLVRFVVTVARAPEGPTEYLRGIVRDYGLGWVFGRVGEGLDDAREKLGEAMGNLLLSTGTLIASAATSSPRW